MSNYSNYKPPLCPVLDIQDKSSVYCREARQHLALLRKKRSLMQSTLRETQKKLQDTHNTQEKFQIEDIFRKNRLVLAKVTNQKEVSHGFVT